MNTGNNQDLGRVIIDAQAQIKSLKSQLEKLDPKDGARYDKTLLQNLFKFQDALELQAVYGRLQYTIQKFENSISNKVDKVVNTMLLSKNNSYLDQTRLPNINNMTEHTNTKENYNLGQYHIDNSYSNKKALRKNLGRDNLPASQILRGNSNNRSRDSHEHSMMLMRNHNDDSQSIQNAPQRLNQTYDKRNNQSFEIVNSQNTSIIRPRIDTTYKKRVHIGRISKQPEILPPEIRKNPFAEAVAITESEINQGIYNLMNRGKIPQDMDIMPAFERGVPPLFNRQAQFHEYYQKNFKQEISVEPKQDIFNIKVDLKPPQNPYNNELIKRRSKTNSLKAGEVVAIKNFGLDFKKSTPVKKNNHDDSLYNIEIDEFDPQSYPQVLDSYSLHHCLIRKGKVIEDTPEFISYKRTYHQQWGGITSILKDLEKIGTNFQIPMFYVDGKQIANLANNLQKPTLAQLYNCIVNQQMYVSHFNSKQIMLFTADGQDLKDLAAIQIQSFIKMRRQRKRFLQIRIQIKKAQIIQKYAKIYIFQMQTQRKIKQRNEKILQDFQSLNYKFKSEWNEIQLRKRVEVHINSFSFDELKRLNMENQLQRENIQVTRIFGIQDPLLTIIYVCPFPISDEVINYYYKILELGETPNYQDRLYFIKPENAQSFPSHFSLAKKLIYSPKSIQRIQKLIKGKHSYIVSGFPSNDDIKLATLLNSPLLNGDPQSCFVNSSKSASKRIFTSAGIQIPISAKEIYDETEFINTLTVLVANNPDVETWIFQIDDEFQGRGIATFNVETIPYLTQTIYSYPMIDETVISQVRNLIATNIQFKTKMAHHSLYQDYRQFIKAFTRRGGIIESSPIKSKQTSVISSPSVSFFISPADGETKIISSYEKISGQPYINVGCSFPQISLSPAQIDIKGMCQKIGEILYIRGVTGFVTVDLIAFSTSASSITSSNHNTQGQHNFVSQGEQNNTSGQMGAGNGAAQFEEHNESSLELTINQENIDGTIIQYFGIGIDCYLNNFTASYFYFHYLMGGQFEENSLKYLAPNSEGLHFDKPAATTEVLSGQNNLSSTSNWEERSYFYSPYIFHPGLSNVFIKNFFQMCRLEAVSFDLERQQGSTFILIDILQQGVLGLLTIGQDIKATVKLMNQALTFLMKQAGSVSSKYSEPFGEARRDNISISDLIGRIRLLNRKLQKDDYGSNYN